MTGISEAHRSLRADFLAGVLIELHAWLESDGPDRDCAHRTLHRWVGTAGTIGLPDVSEEARGLRTRTLAGDSWGLLRPRCEALLRIARGHLAETTVRAADSASAREVVLRIADAKLRAQVTLELASLRPAPRIVEESTELAALVVWDGAGTSELEEYLERHASAPVGRRSRVLVLCEPGVVPGWIARRACPDVQFLIGLSDRAHLRETLLSLLREGHRA